MNRAILSSMATKGLVVLSALFAISCCSIKVAPQGGTRTLLKENVDHPVQENLGSGRIGICRLDARDMYTANLFKSFVDSLEARYKGKVVKNYDPASGGYVSRFVDFEIRPEYRFNKGTSVAVSWPGCLVLAPTWWGLVYTLDLNTKITVYDGARKRVIDEIYFKESFRVRHTSAGRAVWCYTLGLHPLFGCPSGAFSGWDDEFTEAVTGKIIEKKLFAEAYTIRLLRVLSDNSVKTARRDD